MVDNDDGIETGQLAGGTGGRGGDGEGACRTSGRSRHETTDDAASCSVICGPPQRYLIVVEHVMRLYVSVNRTRADSGPRTHADAQFRLHARCVQFSLRPRVPLSPLCWGSFGLSVVATFMTDRMSRGPFQLYPDSTPFSLGFDSNSVSEVTSLDCSSSNCVVHWHHCGWSHGMVHDQHR